jgi:hypothetical protein
MKNVSKTSEEAVPEFGAVKRHQVVVDSQALAFIFPMPAPSRKAPTRPRKKRQAKRDDAPHFKCEPLLPDDDGRWGFAVTCAERFKSDPARAAVFTAGYVYESGRRSRHSVSDFDFRQSTTTVTCINANLVERGVNTIKVSDVTEGFRLEVRAPLDRLCDLGVDYDEL